MSKNLWPKDILEDNNVKLPITILQEQASFLNEMTKNILVAKVETRKVLVSKSRNESERGILHVLKIEVPAIGNYDFELLSLTQGGMLPYPLYAYSPLIESDREASNEEDLLDFLTRVFEHKKTINALQSLILQSKG